ncbi:MAG TPA: hypothetical protein VGI73_01555 [Solirubrobacterales bacterium]|jgi:hypothetical protein
MARGLEPVTVRLYAEDECGGSVVGEGSLTEFEGEGFAFTVGQDSTTIFSAQQSNGAETSPCSPGVTYRQVSTAPPAPDLTASVPVSPGNSNFPRLHGTSADADVTISIYANPSCTGTPENTGTAEEFEAFGIEVAVANNSETTFYAKAVIAGFASTCSSSSITYREVAPPPAEHGGGSSGGTGGGGSSGGGSVAPATPVSRPSPPAPPQLRTVPGGIGNDPTPTITGSAPGATTVLVYASSNCAGQPVAKGSADQFGSSGFEVQVAPNGSATFTAVAGVTGAQSGCSAPITYVEDSLAPHTRITMGPASKTAKRKAVFRFTDTTGNVPGTTFFCKVGKAKWKRCASPFSVVHLKSRSYTVSVRAVDEAGNAEAKGATRRFKVLAGS